MALTYSVIRQGVTDNKRFVEADVTFDNSYVTGGMTVSLASLGLNRVDRAHVVHNVYVDGGTTAFTTHGRQVVPVVTNVYAPLLKVYTGNNAEAANASDQTQIVSRVRFIGA